MSREKTTTNEFHPVEVKRDHVRPRGQPQLTNSEVEAALQELFLPAANGLSDYYHNLGLRWRILSLPVMLAALLSLVWRRIPSVRVLAQTLANEPLLWSAPRQVSQQALDQRLRCLPAALFGQVLEQALPELESRSRSRTRPQPPVVRRALEHFERLWLLDATTLEALFHKLEALRERKGVVLGGKVMALLDLSSKLPVKLWLDDDPAVNEKAFLERIKAALPPATLLIFDLGFYAFPFFDWLSDHQVSFITRARDKGRFKEIATLHSSTHARDRIVQFGQYASNPCRHPLRLIELCHKDRWHRYLTNVLEPETLGAADVASLYTRRWCIEETFQHTKRLLGLSYLWSGAHNAIEMQVWASFMFYCVLIDLCDQVAELLGHPLDAISIEMVYRGLYHYAVAQRTGRADDPAKYLATQGNLGIVKVKRRWVMPDYLDELPMPVNL
jgi:hypothetical protein